jgi:TetR/AcrR family transcriptional repressor of lmrAB and yxaGH operons
MIDATSQLLRRQGVGATGVQQVIDVSGAPRGSLYHHFPGGKHEMVAEAVQRSGQLGAERIEALGATATGQREVVDRFIEEFEVSLKLSDFADGCPIATVALEVAGTPGAMSDAVARAFAAWIGAFSTLLERDGLDRQTADDLATDVLTHVEGAILLSKALRSTRPLELARRTVHTLLTTNGVGT